MSFPMLFFKSSNEIVPMVAEGHRLGQITYYAQNVRPLSLSI